MSLHSRIITALGEVHAPECDEPITTLAFVSSCTVSPDGDVEIALRLPAPRCVPNFAFLMAADAREVVCRLPGVRGVQVRLEDHPNHEELNGAIGAQFGLRGACDEEADTEDLEQLRELYQRKALVARQSRICEQLLSEGLTDEGLCAMTIADLDGGRDATRCVELRSALGLSCGLSDPAFVLPNGWTLEAGELRRWLRTAQLLRTSLEVNGGICRSLLAHRYQLNA